MQSSNKSSYLMVLTCRRADRGSLSRYEDGTENSTLLGDIEHFWLVVFSFLRCDIGHCTDSCRAQSSISQPMMLFLLQSRITRWVSRHSTLVVQELCLVLQLGIIKVNGAQLQFQTQPMDKSGTVSRKKKTFFCNLGPFTKRRSGLPQM